MALYLDSWLSEALLAIGALVVASYVYMRWVFTYWKRRNIPYLEPSFPFGNASDLLFQRKSIGEAVADWYRKLAGHKMGGLFQVNTPILVPRDPELIKEILVKDFMYFHDTGFYTNAEADPISAHLFGLQGERWKNLRVRLTPLFTSGKMKTMFHTFHECCEQLKSYFSGHAAKEEVVEVSDVLGRFTSDVIASCVFGMQCNCLKNPDAEFRLMGKRAVQPDLMDSVRFMVALVFPAFAKLVSLSLTPEPVANFFRRVVQETVAHRRDTGEERKDFMQLLIQLKATLDKSDYSPPFSMDDLTAQAFIFFVAGFETSANTMSFCLFELAKNPEIQEQLRKEIQEAIEENGVTYETVLGMGLLDRVVSETLRKYPSAPAISRGCVKDYHIARENITIEKGTKVFVSILGLQRDPTLFPDPEKFDPDRFLNKSPLYLSFGEGPRSCIGSRFALLQIKVALTLLLSTYKFHVCHKTEDPITFKQANFLLSPDKGVWLKVTRATGESEA